MDQHPLFRFQDVSFAYPDKAPVLDHVDLDVVKGGFYRLHGPSGAGKSTVLRLLCRLEEPTGGSILYRGQNVLGIHPPELRKSVRYFQQSPTLLAGSILDNLLLPFSFLANAERTAPPRENLEAMLEEFNLANVSLDQPAKGLSLGQKQRICLIRTLLVEPEVLLLDEPTSSLDPESAATVLRAASRLNQKDGITIFLVTHALPPEVDDLQTIEVSGGSIRIGGEA